jgi:hypothetical protein
MGPGADDIEHESDCAHIYDNETSGKRWADAVQAAEILPQCNDGIDNDGDTKIDWDGGPGAELALVPPPLGLAASRRRLAN